MKYISITKPKLVEIKEKEVPAPKKDEALLKMLYGGICGSDLSTYRGTMAYSNYPCIPGHEWSAEIVEIPDNKHNLKKGDVVTGLPYFNCGKCYPCQKGLLNCCEHNATMGVQREGSFSEYFTMPIERLYSGKGLDPKHLAMVEPFCISFHGVQRGQVSAEDNVLIVGAGAIGVFAAISAKLKGAHVWISDIEPEKIKFAAKNFDVDGTVLNDNHDHFMEQVNDITDNNGFDVTIEAVGRSNTFQDCIDAAAFGGRMVQIGVGKSDDLANFFFTIIQKKELNIFGSRNALKADFLHLIDFLKDDNIDLDKMISNIVPLDEAPTLFDKFDKHSGDMLKNMIKF